MNKEQERLLTMRKENKISECDYQMLSNALNKKSIFADIENSMLINPFQKIAGFKALILGLTLMLIMSILGVYGNIYYDGVFGYFVAESLKTTITPGFTLLLYQNIVACLSITVIFLAVAIFFRQKNIRIIDFFGTVALSRYPILISLLFTMLEKYLKPENFIQDVSKGIELHISIIGIIGHFVFFICLIWQIMTYFSALKEASGLQGKKLWTGFIIAIILSDVIAGILTRFFFYS